MQYTRKFTFREEMANGISHIAGTLLAIAGLILMVYFSISRGNIWHLVSTSIFGISMITLYLSSTLTHILPPGRIKDFFFNFDRIAIYLLIAGTYTPIALITLHGPVGWIIFGIEWGLALTGIIMIFRKPGNFDDGVNIFYILSYAVMGWLILIVIVPVIRLLPLMGWLWIFIGGICYTLGIFFYKLATFRYHHLVWHLLVVAGSISHFFSVFFYMIPGK
ncbi:MAG TPA: hemolysin III family protein [Bacteroidaceae bacterium]|nr:hemolysin III family protein [Bacteroidaceae bacterium]